MNIKEFTEYLVKSIVSEPDMVKVSEFGGEDDSIILEVIVCESDRGTVIGKSGGGGFTLKRNGGWDRCSTGAHLHFMILPGSSGSSTINPRKMVNFPAKGKSFSTRW